MDITSIYNRLFLDEIKKYAGTDKIIVTIGAPPQLLETVGREFFADPATFLDEKSDDLFTKEWFTQVFSELNTKTNYYILSYAQYIYLIKYITPDFFGNRFLLICDNLRKIFPIDKKEYRESHKTAENLEARPDDLPLHHSEQIKIDGRYYYVLQQDERTIEYIDLFSKKKELIPITSDNLKILDIGTDKFALDIFINELLEDRVKYKSVALKLNKKFPVDTTRYEKLAHLLDQIGIKLYSLEEEIIVPEIEIGEGANLLLKKYWGEHANFRRLSVYKNPNISKDVISISQGEVVQTIINEIDNSQNERNCRDLFLTAPTGSGKSLLFQLPSFYASERGMMTIVVSPLIALMKDQVRAINTDRKFDKVAYLNSELTLVDREKILDHCHNGKIDILYLSPELLLSYDLSHFIGTRSLGLMVIDEAHLITTWGRDFRVDYWFLGNHIRKMKKYNSLNFPLVAVTATAIFGGDNDMVFDSIDNLYMNDPHMYIGEVKRTDIEFMVNNYDDFDTKYEKKKLDQTADFIRNVVSKTNFKTLVYTPYSKHVRQLVTQLTAEGTEVKGYYGALDKDSKQYSYDQFLSGQVQVMISTKAFGMGIDISDIQVVYHHAPSGLLPDYVQEVGRLARDKDLKGYAALNYSKKDQRFSKALHGMSALRNFQLRLVLEKISKTYEATKRRNLLLSVEDFAFIFNDHDDLDQKVLTSLMMIEKDYLAKHRFNVIIARPKKLFVKVYGKLSPEHSEKLSFKYGKFFKVMTLTKNGDVIIELSLDQVWESYFNQKSFPMLKRQFYQDKIFKDEGVSIIPQIKAEYELSLSNELATAKFQAYLEAIRNTLSNLKGYFTDSEFRQTLNSHINNSDVVLKLGNYLLASYSGRLVKPGVIEPNAFLQKRRVGARTEYQVFSNRYLNDLASLERLFVILFANSRKASRYLTKDESSAQKYSRLGYLLELLDLGAFEIKGGDNPMVFIRLNDPIRVAIDSRSSNYENTILTKTLSRHKISSEIFDHFFLRQFQNKDRWDFIEDYFLGADTETLLEDFPGEENTPLDIVEELAVKEQSKSEPRETNQTSSNISLKLFPPNNEIWYDMYNLLTLDVEGTKVTKKVSKWLAEDPVSFSSAYDKHGLRLDSLVYKTMISKLRSKHPHTYKSLLGTKVEVKFPGYNGTIKAIVPYKDAPLKFYKWWINNETEVILTFKEKIELFLEIDRESPGLLLSKHKKLIK